MIITGYITLDIYFKTDEGPILIKVEAYVVKGMSAPFIFGNDFADQYSISLLREEGESTLLFGKSGWSKKVHNSVTSSLLDEDGHVFKVQVRPNITSRVLKAKMHWKSQKAKRRINQWLKDDCVHAVSSVSIAPESTKLIKVQANFTQNSNHLFIEKRLATNSRPENIYGCADTLVAKESLFVYVSNFSQRPIIITAGQVISQGHDPSDWLNSENQLMKEQWGGVHAHTNLLQSIINSGETSVGKNPFAQMVQSEVKVIYDASQWQYFTLLHEFQQNPMECWNSIQILPEW